MRSRKSSLDSITKRMQSKDILLNDFNGDFDPKIPRNRLEFMNQVRIAQHTRPVPSNRSHNFYEILVTSNCF